MSRRLRIALRPQVLRWARQRASLTEEELANGLHVRTERVLAWEQTGKISVAQADKLAQRTHTPLGFLYLSEPPESRLPIADFRTRRDEAPRRPSVDLIETVETMQRRQAWMRDELIDQGAEPLPFVAAYQSDAQLEQVATAMRRSLGLAHGWASRVQTWSEALRELRVSAERAGVLVVFNGIVGNNTHRSLDPAEFQGFALVDEYAPLVFINGADFRAAQMFTLAHELAHLFVGETGVSVFRNLEASSHVTERSCNRIAAEFLVPEQELRNFWRMTQTGEDPYQAIARQFKVSTLVAARRAFELDLTDRDAFHHFYQEFVKMERRTSENRPTGGDFWKTQNWRIGRRFGAAVVRAVKEGRLLYREAYNLTGLRGDTFESMAEKMDLKL